MVNQNKMKKVVQNDQLYLWKVIYKVFVGPAVVVIVQQLIQSDRIRKTDVWKNEQSSKKQYIFRVKFHREGLRKIKV